VVSCRSARRDIWEATMRKLLLVTAGVLVLGGATTGILIANAQPAPPSASVGGQPPGPKWMGWMRRDRGMRQGEERGPNMRQTFALVYRQEDRNLTPPDVQKIAEAFLLWNGNHTWKVVNVAAGTDGDIAFSLATQEGSVIASFTMDPHSGRVTRTN
jgi:hypothetical protein